MGLEYSLQLYGIFWEVGFMNRVPLLEGIGVQSFDGMMMCHGSAVFGFWYSGDSGEVKYKSTPI